MAGRSPSVTIMAREARPLVMMLNSPSAGDFSGRSEMADIISKVDAISRTLTNMQVAAEIAAIPSNVISGVSEDDSTDRDGKPIPTWEAYWTKLEGHHEREGHIEQLTAADLKNFTAMVDRMFVWCAIELGLPTRYAGMDTANPASEGAVVADEFRFDQARETANAPDGDAGVGHKCCMRRSAPVSRSRATESAPYGTIPLRRRTRSAPTR